jgi:hypothetical protein
VWAKKNEYPNCSPSSLEINALIIYLVLPLESSMGIIRTGMKMESPEERVYNLLLLLNVFQSSGTERSTVNFTIPDELFLIFKTFEMISPLLKKRSSFANFVVRVDLILAFDVLKTFTCAQSLNAFNKRAEMNIYLNKSFTKIN